jgi:LemA protein
MDREARREYRVGDGARIARGSSRWCCQASIRGGFVMARSIGVSSRSLCIPLFVIMLGLIVSGCGVNNIPTFDEQAKAKWSDVQNQYQRRADLIPNLVETVKGYATQEREVLTQVIEARAKASQIKVDASTINDPTKFKEYQDAQNALTGALGRLLVTVERYPDLKSNQNFLALQSQLEGTENRIAIARKDYIEAVRAYNTELRTWPGIIWAKTVYSGSKPMETFTAIPDAQKPPSVKF